MLSSLLTRARGLLRARGAASPSLANVALPVAVPGGGTRSVRTASVLAAAADAVIVVDLSGSMATTDWPPTRLAAARDAGIEFVTQRAAINPDARVAVVGFSDSGCVHCALTSLRHHRIVTRALQDLQIAGGTKMYSGLETAGHVLRGCAGGSEIHFLSDGWDYGDQDPVALAAELKGQGITIHTIGIGAKPSDVDEVRLKAIASIGDDGKPLYRFIGDKQRLIQHFGNLGRGITR